METWPSIVGENILFCLMDLRYHCYFLHWNGIVSLPSKMYNTQMADIWLAMEDGTYVLLAMYSVSDLNISPEAKKLKFFSTRMYNQI